MLANDNEPGVKITGSFDTALSADEELDVVREQVARAREDTDTRIEPTLDLDEIDSLLSNAFAAASEEDVQAVEGLNTSEDELLDAALFDDESTPDNVPAPETEASSASATEAPQESLTDTLRESLANSSTASPGADGQMPPEGLNFNEGVNASLDAAQRQQAADTMESIARANAPGAAGDLQSQRHEVGIIQGMSMLGGAGLVGLTKMLRAGGAQINNTISSRKYGKLSGEVDSLTQNMDGILSKFGANGFSAGLKGLKGENKAEFVKEFMANPANKQMLDDLVQAVGTLSTKASQAAIAGAASGLSGDQLDVEISRKIKNVSEKHKEMLDSLHDHNGTKLSERLSELMDGIADFLKSVFTKVAEAFGYNQRTERPGMM